MSPQMLVFWFVLSLAVLVIFLRWAIKTDSTSTFMVLIVPILLSARIMFHAAQALLELLLGVG